MFNYDYNKIKKESEAMQISPFLLIKRKINYRKCRQKELDCRFCDNLRFTGTRHDQKKHCDIIGFSFDKNAEIDHLHICDEFKKIGPVERYDYKYIIQGENNGSN
jgi:hypothetical protein